MATSSVLAAAASAAGDAAEKGGLPQLDFTTFPSQIFWLVVAFVGLFMLMSKVALPRIASVLEERADAIADDLDRAEDFRRKAEEAEAAYEQALKDARAKAQEIAGETRAEIQAQVAEATAKADAEIAARAAEGETRIAEIRDSAMQSVQQVAEDTGIAVVEAVMPDLADANAIKAAITNRLGS
jgi:F-type H+-transporting ATPase subunit b